jgi:DDE superfamily endonuclease/Homeodomain-like domain
MALAVVINDVMRGGLEALTRAGNTAQKLAQRARIVLLASQGKSDSEISRELNIDRKTATLWRGRMAEPQAADPTPQPSVEPVSEAGTLAPPAQTETKENPSARAAKRLRDRRPQSGRKRVVTPEMRERILHTTLRVKPEGRTHWTTRSLAQHLGISKMAVQRVWKAEKLQPHRMETFKFSKDKRFVEKLTEVVGIYKDPPPGSVVYCVDEKPGIQALDRTQPGLPWKKGKCGTRTHDYKRHGTTTLFAAYNVGTGQVIGECHPQHTHQEFLCLLRRLDRETAPGLDIHIILDNASYHSHDNVKKWLGKHRRFQFHFIPTSSSWTNLVERWFGLLTEQCIRRGVFHSVGDLQMTIYRYMQTYNLAPKPFRWRASVRKILEKIQRAAWIVGVTLPWSLPPAVAA